MFRTIDQSLFAAAFIGIGVIAGTGTGTGTGTPWTLSEASLSAIMPDAGRPDRAEAEGAPEPVVTAKARYR